MEKNILLTIEYDGSVFHGWQRQPDRPTLQGHLEKTISALLKKDIVLNGTSRTDAGVHAYGQRASFKADVSIPVEKLAKVINNALNGREKGTFASSPVRIVAAEEKPDDFHARFDSRGKKYIYRIKNSEQINVFERNYVYHVDRPLDTEVMKRQAGKLKGTHDFKSFEAEKDIEIHVSGDGFLYNMVRIIAGTLTDMGSGRLQTDMDDILNAKDRQRAGHTAPPYGLYLAEVYY